MVPTLGMLCYVRELLTSAVSPAPSISVELSFLKHTLFLQSHSILHRPLFPLLFLQHSTFIFLIRLKLRLKEISLCLSPNNLK